MQIIPFPSLIFDNILVYGATLLSYVVLQHWICTGQVNKILTLLITIHGTNSPQDIKLGKTVGSAIDTIKYHTCPNGKVAKPQ